MNIRHCPYITVNLFGNILNSWAIIYLYLYNTEYTIDVSYILLWNRYASDKSLAFNPFSVAVNVKFITWLCWKHNAFHLCAFAHSLIYSVILWFCIVCTLSPLSVCVLCILHMRYFCLAFRATTLAIVGGMKRIGNKWKRAFAHHSKMHKQSLALNTE